MKKKKVKQLINTLGNVLMNDLSEVISAHNSITDERIDKIQTDIKIIKDSVFTERKLFADYHEKHFDLIDSLSKRLDYIVTQAQKQTSLLGTIKNNNEEYKNHTKLYFQNHAISTGKIDGKLCEIIRLMPEQTDYTSLINAAKHFVEKVHTGKAKSKESYNEFISALKEIGIVWTDQIESES